MSEQAIVAKIKSNHLKHIIRALGGGYWEKGLYVGYSNKIHVIGGKKVFVIYTTAEVDPKTLGIAETLDIDGEKIVLRLEPVGIPRALDLEKR